MVTIRVRCFQTECCPLRMEMWIRFFQSILWYPGVNPRPNTKFIIRSDGFGDIQLENFDDVQGDEAMTEDRVVAEEGMVADEEEAVGVREYHKEETLISNKETVDVVAENDEEETMVQDEKKSLDTEMETEKSVDADMETEKSLDIEMENEKSLETEMETQEEANIADEDKEREAEMETETELAESSKKASGGKRKRGGNVLKTTSKSSAASRKTIEEDVCFICFDGGDRVLCDRRNCPKAYHPSCVNRDDAFFQSKGRWNCDDDDNSFTNKGIGQLDMHFGHEDGTIEEIVELEDRLHC